MPLIKMAIDLVGDLLRSGQLLTSYDLNDLVLDLSQGFLRKDRCGDRLGKQFDACFTFGGRTEAAQCDDRTAPLDSTGKFRSYAVETFCNRLGVLVSGPFIEHAVYQRSQARRVAVATAAGGKTDTKVEHGQLRCVYEGYASSTGGHPLLNVTADSGYLPSIIERGHKALTRTRSVLVDGKGRVVE
ncbi:hypothetical protein D3C80_1510570 [compost metagenome]